MPLRECHSHKMLSSYSREKHPNVQNLKSKLKNKPGVFDRISEIIDQMIDEVVEKNWNKLVYTRSGFLLGHHSPQPDEANYVWAVIPKTLIGKTNQVAWQPMEEKLVLQTIGCMVMWRIALRPEKWLVNFTETNKIDIVSGNYISIAEYFIPTEPRPVGIMAQAFALR